jgi:hypothetical protein
LVDVECKFAGDNFYIRVGDPPGRIPPNSNIVKSGKSYYAVGLSWDKEDIARFIMRLLFDWVGRDSDFVRRIDRERKSELQPHLMLARLTPLDGTPQGCYGIRQITIDMLGESAVEFNNSPSDSIFVHVCDSGEEMTTCAYSGPGLPDAAQEKNPVDPS